MKTKNLELELMLHSQQNKEVFFNEAIGIIDSFVVQSVAAFIPSIPTDADKKLKFIITEGELINYIGFCSFENKPWKYIEPKFGMIIYCTEIGEFIHYDGSTWKKVNTTTKEVVTSSSHFIEAIGEVYLSGANYHFLYMQGDIILRIDPLTINTTNIIIKQNTHGVFNVVFTSNILWQCSKPYITTQIPNSIDYIRLTKIPETEHYLGEIVFNGYIY